MTVTPRLGGTYFIASKTSGCGSRNFRTSLRRARGCRTFAFTFVAPLVSYPFCKFSRCMSAPPRGSLPGSGGGAGRSFLDVSRCCAAHQGALRQSVVVLPDFVSVEEEHALVAFAEAGFGARGMHAYARGPGLETGGCIDCYREFDVPPDELRAAQLPGAVVRRMRGLLKLLTMTQWCASKEEEEAGSPQDTGFSPHSLQQGADTLLALETMDYNLPDEVLYPTHRIIDLAADGGVITPHVDEQDRFGRFVLVLNLMTDCVIRLRALPPLEDRKRWLPCPAEFADVIVPQRGAYLLSGLARYAYAHEVLSVAATLRPARRVSLVGRDAGPALSPLGDGAFAPERVAGEAVGLGTHWPRITTQLGELTARDVAQWLNSFSPTPQST